MSVLTSVFKSHKGIPFVILILALVLQGCAAGDGVDDARSRCEELHELSDLGQQVTADEVCLVQHDEVGDSQLVTRQLGHLALQSRQLFGIDHRQDAVDLVHLIRGIVG